MPLKNKRLRIMAGPNGSGKSTVLQEVRKKFYSGPFVNADDIEKSFQDKGLVNLPAIYDLEISDQSF
jgi:predicted ABC-type ATPase